MSAYLLRLQDMGSYVTELTVYAQTQLAYGEQLIAAHVSDQTGCCRQCGRVAPCDSADRGKRLVERFSGLK